MLLLLLLLVLQINSGAGSEAAQLKAAGNAAFKARDWATAIRMYRCATATFVRHDCTSSAWQQ
jgi:hypothetical protein